MCVWMDRKEGESKRKRGFNSPKIICGDLDGGIRYISISLIFNFPIEEFEGGCLIYIVKKLLILFS